VGLSLCVGGFGCVFGCVGGCLGVGGICVGVGVVACMVVGVWLSL
jgi:hypothetical protein